MTEGTALNVDLAVLKLGLEIIIGISVFVGALWTVMKFIFLPRLMVLVQEHLAALVERVSELEGAVDKMRVEAEQTERSQERMHAEMRQTMTQLAGNIEAAVKLANDTAIAVGRIEGAQKVTQSLLLSHTTVDRDR